VAALAIWPAKNAPVETDSRGGLNDSLLTTAFHPTSPSVWTYRHAVIHSPESLDILLDQHSAVTRDGKRDPTPLNAFARLDSKTNDILGEL
jgi:hypothetical protein